MENKKFPIEKFEHLETPFYYYDTQLLAKTLDIAQKEAEKYDYLLHYAIKANANPQILQQIAKAGFGADCVSGNEIKAAIDAGFPSSKIVFAGVGKTDKEILLALNHHIACFNVESLPELEVINMLAQKQQKTAPVALRINPNVDAHTHKYITTGLKENKFGFSDTSIPHIIKTIKNLTHVHLTGLHFHIGSQITHVDTFVPLCERINQIQEQFKQAGIIPAHLNVGGGLGIDYQHPDQHPIPPFKEYFEVFHKHLKLQNGQQVHFEPGRSIVGQCGTLISRATYVKQGETKTFIIADAGMSDLIRPALYQAFHKVENLSSSLPPETYDVVGPICESSDVFAENISLNKTSRGDLLAFRSAGAYGEIMASRYNCRELPKAYFSDSL